MFLSSNLFLENKTSRGLKTLEKTANSLINNRKKCFNKLFQNKSQRFRQILCFIKHSLAVHDDLYFFSHIAVTFLVGFLAYAKISTDFFKDCLPNPQ